jgi:hypothetical protein
VGGWGPKIEAGMEFATSSQIHIQISDVCLSRFRGQKAGLRRKAVECRLMTLAVQKLYAV